MQSFKKTAKKLLSLALVLCMLLSTGVVAFAASTENPATETESAYFTSTDWIWSSDTVTANSISYFRHDYDLKADPVSIAVRTSAHNHLKFYVNGNLITGYVSPAPTALPENINYLSYTFTGSDLEALLNADKTQLALAAAVQYMGSNGMNYINAKPGFWAEVTVSYADGSSDTFLTDTTWRALKDTPYKNGTPSMSGRQMNAQLDYDAQKMPDPLAWTLYGYDESTYTAGTWTAAVPANAETATWKMRQQGIPEGAVHEEITPTAVGRQQAGWQVFDVGRIATGWVKIKASAPAGTRICIRYSEDLNGDVVKHNVANEGSETYCDYYTFSGNGVEEFTANFDYKAFRYFEVVGLTDLITVEDVTMEWASTDLEYTADFSSSNEMLNKIYQACINTQINNVEGMPVDCPHREQSQYLADSQVQYALLSYAFSNFEDINYKTMLDFASQQFDDGLFSFVAPSQMYAAYGSLHIPEWDLRYTNMLYNYYWVSGDKTGLAEFYDDACENVSYYYDGVDSMGLMPQKTGGSWWHISDHPEKYVPDNVGPYPTVCNLLLYDSLNHLSMIADVLGKTDEASAWSVKANALRAAINANLLNHETGLYYDYSSTTNTNPGVTAMAINLGVADSALLDQQLAAISDPSITNTSVVLTYELFRAIMTYGNAQQKQSVYNRILTSWGPMINRGDSTCWEGFRDENSHSHAWTAYPARILLQYFVGVTYNDVDYSDISVTPFLPTGLDNIDGTVTVPDNRGAVSVSLSRADGGYSMTVENTTADSALIAVPRVAEGNTVITSDGQTVFANGKGTNVAGLTYVKNDAEYVYFQADAGTSNFVSTTAEAQTGTFTLTIDAAEGGTVKVGGSEVTLPYSASVEAGTDVVVDAVASPKYAFTGWSGTYGSVNSQFAFTVGSDVALKANFEKREGIVYRTINIEAPAKSGLMVDYNGAQISLPAKLAVADGDTATLKVVETDDSCYKFVAWGGDLFSPKEELTITATENVNLQVIGSYKGIVVDNLAYQKTATANSSLTSAPLWTMANLTDGYTGEGPSGEIGATSGSYPSADISATPHELTLDLGKDTDFAEIVLYPRANFADEEGNSRCFPVDYTVSVCKNGSSSYEEVYSVTDGANPKGQSVSINVGEQNARYIKITTTKVGLPDNWGTYYVQLGEMEVYNRSGVVGDPQLVIDGEGTVLINGEETVLPVSRTYPAGTELAIQPVAKKNSCFSGWTGDLTSSQVPLYLTMDTSISLKANFISATVVKSSNLALNKTVNVPDAVVDGKGSEQWNISYLTDGILTSTGATASDGKKGFTSVNYASPDVTDENLWAEIDLGADTDFNQITLYPRTDIAGASGGSPNFPTAFKLQYKLDGDSVYRDIATFTDVENPQGQPATFDFSIQNGRYVRIVPITLGDPASDDASGAKPYRFQLAEFEVYANELVDNNLGASASITSNNSGSNAGAWSLPNLVDGQVRSAGRGSESGTKGFTSEAYGKDEKDISANPHIITFTFESPTAMNQMVLYPRSDLDGDTAESGLAANFPEDFHIDVLNANGEWQTVYSATGVNDGLSPVVCNFDTVTAKAIRLVTTRLGVCASDELSRSLRVQLAEIKIGNVLRGNINEGSISISADRDPVTITSYEDLVQLTAAVEDSDLADNSLIWSIEDEQGFVADFAELANIRGTSPILSAFAEGSAYVVARFANGLNVYDRIPINVDLTPVVKYSASTADIDGNAAKEFVSKELFKVIVTTPADADDVRLFNEYGMNMGRKSISFVENEDGSKTWTIVTSIGTVGAGRVLTIAPRINGVYENVGCTVTVDIKAVAPKLISAQFDNEVAKVNVPTTLTIVTDTTVDAVSLYNEFGAKIGLLSKSYQDVDGQRVWTVSVKIGTAGAERTFTVKAKNCYGVFAEEELSASIQVVRF